jgi:hypothetical protein
MQELKLKLLEESMNVSFHNHGCGNSFLDMTPAAQVGLQN